MSLPSGERIIYHNSGLSEVGSYTRLRMFTPPVIRCSCAPGRLNLSVLGQFSGAFCDTTLRISSLTRNLVPFGRVVLFSLRYSWAYYAPPSKRRVVPAYSHIS
jgi:hypothetical protein